jgi:hypothetical protein
MTTSKPNPVQSQFARQAVRVEYLEGPAIGEIKKTETSTDTTANCGAQVSGEVRAPSQGMRENKVEVLPFLEKV